MITLFAFLCSFKTCVKCPYKESSWCVPKVFTCTIVSFLLACNWFPLIHMALLCNQGKSLIETQKSCVYWLSIVYLNQSHNYHLGLCLNPKWLCAVRSLHTCCISLFVLIEKTCAKHGLKCMWVGCSLYLIYGYSMSYSNWTINAIWAFFFFKSKSGDN